jgi:outer membrane protein, heavy metal efflux system
VTSRVAARRIGWVGLLLLGLTGCASVDLRAGFPEVSAAVEERSATKIAWHTGTELDREASETLRSLLQRKLTVDDAVKIAMLNNRDLQAIYTELGVAQADLVEAGLLRNPIFDAAVLFPLSGVRPDLQLGVVVGFLDVLYMPLRKRVAAARFEEAKLRVTGAVLDFAGQVRKTFYEQQANEQALELRRTVVQALTASLEVSRRLHEAGNITDLDLARDRALTETSRLALRSAEITAGQSREELNNLMGLWGEDTRWEIDARLPDIPAEPLQVNDVERTAVIRSIDLANAGQRIMGAGQQLGYDRATALIPALELGVEGEREEGWKVGPVLSVRIPLFDQGQARVGRAVAELRRAQREYYALAVRIRSTARAIQDRMRGAQDRALYYRDILLPLQERIVNEAQLQYNAMQIGIFQVLRDRERQIETGAAYVEALREYWLARADLALLSSGRLPISNGFRMGAAGDKGKAKEGVNGD